MQADSLATFAQMLIVGLVITACALGIVTFVPAVAAGVRFLDRHLDSASDGLREFGTLLWQAVKSGWWFGGLAVCTAALLLMNIELGSLGLVPGGGIFGAVSAALALAAVLVVLRIAAVWTPRDAWSALWREHRGRAFADPVGSLLVVAGISVAITIVWMLPSLVVIAPGLVAVSLVAAERRIRQRAQKGTS